MSSETSTERTPVPTGGFHAWHLYLLLGMAGATWAVVEAQDTHPAALLLLSTAVLAAGAVGIAIHSAVLGFFGEASDDRRSLDGGTRAALEHEKATLLRSLKELEFDRAMGKMSDTDFAEIEGRLRARALAVMEQLEQPMPPPLAPAEKAVAVPGTCHTCGVQNDSDARFCKSCGQGLTDD